MNYWTLDNKHKYNIEAVDMGNDSQELADWVSHYIYENSSPSTIRDALDDADAYLGKACKALGWSSIPSVGGLVVDIWDNEEITQA